MTRRASQHAGPPDAAGRTLLLMRHAKSDWSDAAGGDHGRPLNDRGRRDAPRMGQWLAATGELPDRILSSSSLRTRQTVAALTDIWKQSPPTVFLDTLYHAAPREIIDTVRLNGADAKRLLVVAHNPGLASLVGRWAGASVDLPTAAIAIFHFELDAWTELHDDSPNHFLEFMRPKALP